jgi:lycopene cyclase domain-containing protein
MTSGHWQYLLVLAACLAITAPLEAFGPGVYRQAGRAARAIVPVAVVFIVWDVIAIAAHVWTYNPRFITGLHLPGALPVEEVLFFAVIPVCGILTYNAVDTLLQRLRRSRHSVRRA